MGSVVLDHVLTAEEAEHRRFHSYTMKKVAVIFSTLTSKIPICKAAPKDHPPDNHGGNCQLGFLKNSNKGVQLIVSAETAEVTRSCHIQLKQLGHTLT